MPALVERLEAIRLESAWLDGEIVVSDKNGVPNFNALQNALDRSRSGAIQYFVFDMPFFEGYDLRQVPLHERRRLLKTLLDAKGSAQVRFSANFEGDGATILASACRMKLEGVIAKRADAPYVSQRSATWLKLKCTQRQEFVIVGYTDRKGASDATAIGSLLLGVHDGKGKLVLVGSVGTGWDTRTAADLKQRLARIEIAQPPFVHGAGTPGWPGRRSRRPGVVERWVKPNLVAEVSFGEWTPDGQLRHASFEGLRTDKPARTIVREQAIAQAEAGETKAKRR
jgi:bifunctional non-homologous end joining protein LigD